MTVEEFIAAEAAKPFVYGETDCCTTADRWVRSVRGLSPLSFDGWAGEADEAAACIAHPYALPARVNRAMRKAGLRRTIEPRAGDIGLVIFGRRLGVGIHAGTFWFSRGTDGFFGAPIEKFWKAWSVCAHGT